MSQGARAGLRRNLLWTLAGNLAYVGCQWGMLIAIARLGTPAMVGDFALALAVAAPMMVLAMLNLRAAQATDQRGEFAFADYVHLRVACLGAAAVVLAAILAGGDFSASTAWTIALVGIAKACDAASDVVYGLLQQREQMRRIAISRILLGALQLGALIVTLRASGSLLAAVAATATASLAVTLLYDARGVRALARGAPAAGDRPRVLVRPNLRAIARLLVLSLPLGVAAGLDSLNASLPRYALDATAGREALGFYAALAYLLVGQGAVVTAIADAARPRLARAFFAADEEFVALTGRLAGAVGACAVAGVLVAWHAGESVLRLLYGAPYAHQADLLLWIMLAALPWNLSGIATTAIGAARQFRAVSLCFVAMAIATGVASLVLVPAHGAIGAAWALGLGMLVRLGVSSAFLWRICATREPAARLAGAVTG